MIQNLSKYRSALMGIAILWIMLYHLPIRSGNMLLDSLMNIGYGGVDIFLFLSGIGLFFSMSKNSDAGSFYKKRFVRIFPEYWLTLIIVFLIAGDFSVNAISTLLINASTLGYWLPRVPDDYLWYISCIVVLYALFPLFYRWFQKKGLSSFVWGIIVGLILTTLYAVIMVFFFQNDNKGGNYILSISRIPIFFIGVIFGYMAQNRIEITSYKSIVGGLFLLVFSIVFFSLSHLYLPDYLWTCSLLFTPFMVIAPILCLALSWIFSRLPYILTRFFNFFGGLSYELYLVHKLAYQFILPRIQFCSSWIQALIAFSFTIIAALILNYLNKIFLQKVFRKTVHLSQ